MITGRISDERLVKVPASEAWELYTSLRFAKIVEQGLPGFKLDVLQGDGSAGTIVELFFPPAMEGPGGVKSYKEKLTVVDGEKRVKVGEVVEGGYLDLGFTLHRTMFEVIEEEEEGEEQQCITRFTVEYELKPDAAANAAFVTTLLPAGMMQLAARHLERTVDDANDNE